MVNMSVCCVLVCGEGPCVCVYCVLAGDECMCVCVACRHLTSVCAYVCVACWHVAGVRACVCVCMCVRVACCMLRAGASMWHVSALVNTDSTQTQQWC